MPQKRINERPRNAAMATMAVVLGCSEVYGFLTALAVGMVIVGVWTGWVVLAVPWLAVGLFILAVVFSSRLSGI